MNTAPYVPSVRIIFYMDRYSFNVRLMKTKLCKLLLHLRNFHQNSLTLNKFITLRIKMIKNIDSVCMKEMLHCKYAERLYTHTSAYV